MRCHWSGLTKKIAGRHLLPALCQMENRGNGKGGGIAAVGLVPEAFGISQQVLDEDYLLAVAYIDLSCREQLEREYIHPLFHVDQVFQMPHRQADLAVIPPKVILYFVRGADDETVYRNSYQLNRTFYNASGEKRAFVLSHGKNLLVLKMVGYGQDVIHHYQLEDFLAHVWIGHHRYPTKGRVWHPGGAHPFIGLNEALVHNGDFANYFSICEYLAQREIFPHFLTDTEVAALLFDFLHRIEKYPLEYLIEALAPTTERDFTLLSEGKQKIYQEIQQQHIHGSPDGPWFFLVAQSLPQTHRLIGITDTSMLRPQVFALCHGPHPIGFAASEKQAIDATLKSLAKEDAAFWTCADYYWNARGGSYTDGGAFSFTVDPEGFACEDKFGRAIHTEKLQPPYRHEKAVFLHIPTKLDARELFRWATLQISSWGYAEFLGFLDALTESDPKRAIEVATLLLDRHYPLGNLRRSSLQALLSENLLSLFQTVNLPATCLIDAQNLSSEGEHSLARMVVEMFKKGFKKFILFNCAGQRFVGSGLGPHTEGVQIDVYGSSGDYLASGIDGAHIYVHGSGQDQLGQILLSGTLVVHGDVGQTFLYGAKGGKVFVRGNTAGRPLINAVGSPRVVINGTCLDYLAESFMAGNPLKGGGFAIVNGLTCNSEGQLIDLDTPYPGNNLFSLASGGAIYMRDPHHLVTKGQLNGGEFVAMTQHDWELILPYLEENAHHFGISIERLLTHRGKTFPFDQMYRKISPILLRTILDEEAWVRGG